MKVELRNIGPVNRAGIDLDGLAVLVGPNASGKTTLSVAAYAALLSRRATEISLSRYFDRMLMSKRQMSLVEPAPLSEFFASQFREFFIRELQRCFSPELSRLPRRGRTGKGSAPRIMISDSPSDHAPWKLVFRIREGNLTLETKHPDYEPPRLDHLVDLVEQGRAPSTSRRALVARRRRLASPTYFPAARSGYVQMQSVLSSLLLAALGRGYYGEISVGKISGIATDFLQFLANLDPGDHSQIGAAVVARLEGQLLHGRLRIATAGEAAKTVEFAPNGVDEYWPMDSAATSIGELAPLLLYLRHAATDRDQLFIDEPEAHLHPENQVLLADMLLDLSMLIRGMVVGTHSEFFATGLSNAILRRRQSPGGVGIRVRLYELEQAATTGGYVATSSDLDRRGGFSVDQFADVAEDALDEAQELYQRGAEAEG